VIAVAEIRDALALESQMVRSRVMAALLLLAPASCASPPAKTATGSVRPCTALERFLYNAQGLDAEQLCGTEGAALLRRELIPLGAGRVLEWHPLDGTYRAWIVGGDPLLPARPDGSRFDPAADKLGRILVGLGGNQVLHVEAGAQQWKIFDVKPGDFAPPHGVLAQRADGKFPDVFWGHEMIALDGGYLMRWVPGDGSYVVLHYDPAQLAGGSPLTLDSRFSGQVSDFRRGAHLVNLGQGRLLTWVPGASSYQIRRYRFDDDSADIFDAPAAHAWQAPWPMLEPPQQLMVVDRDRILKWDAATGSLALYAFDPDADDPLASARLLAEQSYGSELQSIDPPAPTPSSQIHRMVLILQQGRSFDSLFGQYCTGTPTASGAPLPCNDGPACCERMPDQIAGADACTPLDPADPDPHVPYDDWVCLQSKIADNNAGYTTGCGSPLDFVCAGAGAGAGPIGDYQALASVGALADRFFQTTLDNAEGNVAYLGAAAYTTDISGANGQQLPALLAAAGVRWALYKDHPFDIPLAPPRGWRQPPPSFYDAHWTFYRAPDEIDRDIELQQLATLSTVILPPPYEGSPRDGALQPGIDRVTSLVGKLLAPGSPYASDTLIVIAFLTSGGYYDHVAPPAAYQEQFASYAYGPRVPLLVVGPFARSNYISHVPIELSSVVALTEWNWLGQAGQLNQRDATVASLADLLDPAKTVVPVPLHPASAEP
jgi:phospholipase C